MPSAKACRSTLAIFLRLRAMRHAIATQAQRLLCLLLLRFDEVPTDAVARRARADRAGHRATGRPGRRVAAARRLRLRQRIATPQGSFPTAMSATRVPRSTSITDTLPER